LKDIDSFGDSRGGVISQRSLVAGVAALGDSNASLEKSNVGISDDLAWQSALATSAVEATDEVRDAVAWSRTASRAKAASFTAASKAKMAYESLSASSSPDEIKSAQSEASATQSHAIHATVVEYEANAAKKRAAVSLAQDVKCWNAYRKRELRQTCLEYAKSQRDACGKSADAWESLRDGLIDSSTLCFTPGELVGIIPVNAPNALEEDILISSAIDDNSYTLPEAPNLGFNSDVSSSNLLHSAEEQNYDARSFSGGQLNGQSKKIPPEASVNHTNVAESLNASSTAASLPEAFVDVAELAASSFDTEDSSDNVYLLQPPDIPDLDDDHFALQQDIISSAESSSQSDHDEAMDTCAFQDDYLGIESVLDRAQPDDDQFRSNVSASGENMTTSMQSLIDGLMAWGGDEEPINDIGLRAEDAGKGDDRTKGSVLFE
jgi:hypothetical protein